MTLKEQTDEHFMSVASNGTNTQAAKEAFSYLFEKYHKPIISYLWHSLGDFQLAQDLSHDVFLKAFRSRKMYRNQYRFTTWLWTIAKRTLIDHTRKKKEALFEDQVHSNCSIEEILDEALLETQDSLIKKIESEKLKSYFFKLNNQQREVLSLQVFSQLSLIEISDLLELKINTVKSLAKRAKDNIFDQARHDLKQEKLELEKLESEKVII